MRFFATHGRHGFLVLGSVVLCITGGEALYADMGHFGTRAIRMAWYLWCSRRCSQLLRPGRAAARAAGGRARTRSTRWCPRALAVARWCVLATVATVVASQALISGAFSLTRQAVQLGYLPRVTIVHTSGKTEGQIYIPEVNWLLMVACMALVLGFRVVERSGRRLRHRGHRHDGDHLDALLLRGARPLALGRAGRRARCWRCS